MYGSPDSLFCSLCASKAKSYAFLTKSISTLFPLAFILEISSSNILDYSPLLKISFNILYYYITKK